MKIFKLLRNKNPLNNIITEATLRGPKKKAEKKDIVKSEHILNFYKNADDVAILPDEYYPKWVLELGRGKFHSDEMYDMYMSGFTVIIYLLRFYLHMTTFPYINIIEDS
jgi:hypothetical protein